MFTSLQVRNFRGFHDLALDNLAQVNLIGGKNNSGKTALLESLLLLNRLSLEKIAQFRGVERRRGGDQQPFLSFVWTGEYEEYVEQFFHTFAFEQPVEIIGQRDAEHKLRISMLKEEPPKEIVQSLITSAELEKLILEQRILSTVIMQYFTGDKEVSSALVIRGERASIATSPPSALLPMFYRGARIPVEMHLVAIEYGKIVETLQKESVISFLRLIEPDLSDVVTIQKPAGTELHGIFRGLPRALPLYLVGDGMIRLTDLIIGLFSAQNGILIIDEFENGLHWSVLPKVWRALREIARSLNVQVFATTHSYECIKAAHEAFAEKQDEGFRFYRLGRVDQRIQVVSYDLETLGIALEEGWEVR